MGNIIKINMYAECKCKQINNLKLEQLEKYILKYNTWLKDTNREDKIENYEMFLHVN